MKFLKWYVDKHGALIGGGSLLIVFLFFVLIAISTRGAILVLLPVALLYLIVVEFIEYKEYNDKNDK